MNRSNTPWTFHQPGDVVIFIIDHSMTRKPYPKFLSSNPNIIVAMTTGQQQIVPLLRRHRSVDSSSW